MTEAARGTGRPARALLLVLLAVVSSGAAPVAPAEAQSPPARCEPSPARTATRVGVATVFVGGNLALYEYFRRAWWSGERSSGIWINWERHEPFRQQDKLGHALGGYHLARVSDGLLRVACVSPTKATLYGAAYATAFQLQIELWDGLQKKYGFSPPDLVANALGAGLHVAQVRRPSLRVVKPTVSYARTAALKRAPPGAELRPTIDYSGQTYWLSFDVDSMLPPPARRYWPGLVRLSVGHSITDWVDPATQQTQRARRRLLLSLDLDPEKLPGTHRLWRPVKRQLAYYHFPAPALQLAPGLTGIAWHR